LVSPVIDRFKLLGIFNHTPHKQPNHVLINEYNRGEGIMPHEDGSAYADVVATVSLGASLCLEITPKPTKGEERSTGTEADVKTSETSALSGYSIPTRILQEPRSLLITTGQAYKDLLHGISPIQVDENLNADTVANWNLLGDSKALEEAGGRSERATRVSLTYRDVLKVSSAASRVLGGLGKR
jgi:alkylated DNA repair protein alkB family protein 6